jgi:phage baseplate assembly protein W
MPDTPKLSIPLTITDGRIAQIEQDSEEEIAQCVSAVLRTELGQRIELPSYGLADQAFTEGGADLDAIRSAVEEFEPRAETLTTEAFDGILSRVQVTP